MNAQVELEPVLVRHDKITLGRDVLRVVRVDDRELAALELRVLELDAQQEEMRELCDVNRTDSVLLEEVVPVALTVLVVHAVADVVREEVLDLDRCPESERYARVDSARRQSTPDGGRMHTG